MSAILAQGDVIACAFKQRIFGQIIINTFAHELTVVPPAFSFADWVTGMTNNVPSQTKAFEGFMSQFQPSDVAYVEWEYRLYRGNSPTLESLPGPCLIQQGGAPGAAETANIAAQLTLYGSGAGQSNRGWIHVGGVPQGNYLDGLLLNPAMASINNIGDVLIGEDSLSVPGVVSRLGRYRPAKFGNAPRDARFLWCVRRLARPEIRTQRSRTIGRGM